MQDTRYSWVMRRVLVGAPFVLIVYFCLIVFIINLFMCALRAIGGR